MPLDEGVGACRAPALAARHGLGGSKRRKHGDDSWIGEHFREWTPPSGDDRTLGVVEFSIFPHLDYEGWPNNTMSQAERWAADIAGPAYAIDDQTAIKVVEGIVEVVSEGNWRRFT